MSGAVFSFGIGEIGDRGVLCFEIINHNAYTQYQDKVKEYRPPPPYLGKIPEKVFFTASLTEDNGPSERLLLWIHQTKIRQEKVFPKLYFWV